MATPEQKRKTDQLINAIDREDGEAEALALIADPTVDINNAMDENDNELFFPLGAAAQYDNDPIVDALLARADIDVNKATSDGVTALMVAVQSENLPVIQKLLNSGKPINVNLADNSNKSALDYAYELERGVADRIKIIRALEEKGGKRVQDNARNAILAAPGPTPQKSDMVIEALLQTREGKLPVEKMVEIIQNLPPGQLDIPRTKNEYEFMPALRPLFMTPLQYLFERVSLSAKAVYKAFFDREDFDPNKTIDGTPLLLNAIKSGNFDVIDMLLNHPRIDLNIVRRGPRDIYTPLDMAEEMVLLSRKDKVRFFKDLVEKLKAKGAKRFRDLPVPGAVAEQGPAIAAAPAAAGQGPAVPAAAAGQETVPMWQGYSESDLFLVNSMFDIDEPRPGEAPYTSQERDALVQTKIQNFSMCPVCLRYVIRSDACMFMTHECSPPYHKELYDKFKYKTQNGKTYIEWCTICGRICKGHKHYEIDEWNAPVPGFTTKNAVTNVNAFGTDCKNLGGGGLEEKFMRIQRMIDTICELQAQVGKIPEQEARNILTQRIWDSAVEEPDPVLLVEVMEGKKFRLDEACKAILTKPVGQKETVYTDVKRPADQAGLTPVKYDGVSEIPYSPATRALREQANSIPASSSQKEAAENNAKAAEDAEKENYCAPELGVHDDDRPTYGFRHKQPNGTILDHGMVKEDGVYNERYCGEHLEELLRSINLQDTKGKCPLSDNCNAKLYPEEIQGIVSNEYYENYKRIFNEVNAGMKGGAAIPPIFGQLTDVQEICALPQKAGKKRTRRAKKARKTRKRV